MTLRGGRRVTLRAIRPDDGEALQAAMGRLSGEARYMRFMGGDQGTFAFHAGTRSPPHRGPGPCAGGAGRFAGAAGDGADGSIVAGARYIAGPDLQTCEFAIAVADDWCGMGLASRLMKELIRSARARGLKRMEGFILANNTPMRNLAKRLGFESTASNEGPGRRAGVAGSAVRAGRRDAGEQDAA